MSAKQYWRQLERTRTPKTLCWEMQTVRVIATLRIAKQNLWIKCKTTNESCFLCIRNSHTMYCSETYTHNKLTSRSLSYLNHEEQSIYWNPQISRKFCVLDLNLFLAYQEAILRRLISQWTQKKNLLVKFLV